MNKVTTKLNNNVRKALASADAQAQHISQFNAFRYQVDWSNFPNRLIIHCHLNSLHTTTDAPDPAINAQLTKIAQLSLLKQGIRFRDFRNNIQFIQDTRNSHSTISTITTSPRPMNT